MAVKVSVCIPAYNQTGFLKKTLQSLLDQRYQDFEIVVSDDSSNNQVENLVHEMLAGSGRSYRYHKNSQALGSPANWNKAVSLASGEWIKILHHDDWLSHADSLQEFVNAADVHPESDFIFCASSILNVQNNSYSQNAPDAAFLAKLSEDPRLLFNNNRIGAPSATLVRASAMQSFDQHLKYLVDVDFYLRVLGKNKSVVYLPEALIVNTSHHEAQVTAASINKLTQVGEYCYLYNKVFKGATPNKAYRRFFKDLFAWYQLKSFDELTAAGYPLPQPGRIFNWLLWRAKIGW